MLIFLGWLLIALMVFMYSDPEPIEGQAFRVFFAAAWPLAIPILIFQLLFGDDLPRD